MNMDSVLAAFEELGFLGGNQQAAREAWETVRVQQQAEKSPRQKVSGSFSGRPLRDFVFFQDVLLVVVDESAPVSQSRGNDEGRLTGFGQAKRVKLDEFHVLKHGSRLQSQAVTIPEDIARTLKQQVDTPQGRRDALIMCLLLDHGLRVGEIAILTRKAFDMKAGTFTFYRSKVNKTQTHELTADTGKAAAAYFRHDAPADGILWRKSCKGTGKPSGQMSEKSAFSVRVST